jgi:hypothetical protein
MRSASFEAFAGRAFRCCLGRIKNERPLLDFFPDEGVAEGCDEFEKVGLAFEEVGKEVGILGGQGAELVEERLLGLQLPAERNAWVAVHEYLQAARARRDATHSEIAVGRIVARCLEIQSGRR